MKIINALLSCPSDVFSSFNSEITRAIDDVNFYIEKLIDTRINIQHYLSSSFSQVGKPAQDHLDDTLIIDSDICLAFYYHRLGTATKSYKSGTDEEIHLMRNAGKHVSLFRIYDSKEDKEYEEELEDYFKNISSFSMYKVIIGKDRIFDVVRTDLLNYLVSSFSVDVIKIDEPFGAIEFLKQVINYDLKKNEIIGLITEINDFTARRVEFDNSAKKVAEELKKSEEIQELLANQDYKIIAEVAGVTNGFGNFMKEPITFDYVFDGTANEYLVRFAKENGLDLHQDFLSFHGEKVYKSSMPLVGGNLLLDESPIKEKIEWLEKLSDLLKNYYAWDAYFVNYQDAVFIPLAVINNTTIHQKTVNVKIHINIDDYISPIRLLPNDEVSLEVHALELDTFFNPFRKYAGVEEYGYSPYSPEVTNFILDNMITDYKATVDKWFGEMFGNYETERVNDEIVLTVRFNGLNAEEKHSFPTYLILKNTVKSIYYEISGSDLPRKHSGKIEIK